jgi:chromosome segregation ATPase
MWDLVNNHKMQPGMQDVARSTNVDPLDQDLWAAAQTIRACRQDRIAASQGYHALQESRKNLQSDYAGLVADYNELYSNYDALRGRYSNLREKYNSVLADSTKLESAQTALEQQKALKRVVEAQLAQTKDEMEKKHDQVAQLEKKLATTWLQAVDGQGNDTEKLKATINSYKEENAVQAAENIAAKTLIQHMEDFQRELEQSHVQEVGSLRQQNKHLEEALQETVKVQEERKQIADKLEIDKNLLQQRCQLQIQQLGSIRKALANWLPDLHDEFDNITTVLAELEKRTRKKRKQVQ